MLRRKPKGSETLPTAVVMNMYYTGLGIARSLGEQSIPVLGLTAQHRIYGNFTRYGTPVFCPDSRHDPEALLPFLLRLGKDIGHRAIIFPTRDDDLIFLDRFRDSLTPYFTLALPPSPVLEACLNKWESYRWARQAGVATPKCWLIEAEVDLRRVLPELTYPCVLKPLSSHHWRRAGNWNLVGARKAIGIFAQEQLLAEYAAIARADQRALLQQMVPGPDDCLFVAACYFDRASNYVAGFNVQKLVQSPEGFGTGCIVQAVNRPELFDPTVRLLKQMRFTGIAEVEYKWDAATDQYKLIEINPRPWDQHRLGNSCGVDLIHVAYCDLAGLPAPKCERNASSPKWIAEDTFVTTALWMLRKRDPKVRTLFRRARGKRIYAIWSARDPLPLLAYLVTRFIPELITAGVKALWWALRRRVFGNLKEKGPPYERHFKKANTPS